MDLGYRRCYRMCRYGARLSRLLGPRSQWILCGLVLLRVARLGPQDYFLYGN